jgi:hypothetical protein
VCRLRESLERESAELAAEAAKAETAERAARRASLMDSERRELERLKVPTWVQPSLTLIAFRFGNETSKVPTCVQPSLSLTYRQFETCNQGHNLLPMFSLAYSAPAAVSFGSHEAICCRRRVPEVLVVLIYGHNIQQ